MNILKGAKGETALNRVMAFGGCVILSLGFVKESAQNGLEWLDYLGYATGMTILYAPVAAVKLIAAMKGLPAEAVVKKEAVADDKSFE